MELKKSPKADLEKDKRLFTLIGSVIALVIFLTAFSLKTYDEQEVKINRGSVDNIEEEAPPITEEKPPPPPPPDEQPPPPIATEIEEVKDDVEVEDVQLLASDADKFTPPTFVPQQAEEEFKEDEIFIIVEEPAEFAGGEAARRKFLEDNMKYPQIAREMGIQGTVYLEFIVEPDGSLTNITVRRGIGGGCDEEALRVTSIMPKWKPGKQRNKAVRVRFNMPIKFVLN